MSEDIAKQWLFNSTTTANNKDLNGHMNLISKKVSLQGIPGFDEIGFDDWQSQCQHEFENSVIKQVSYSGLKMISTTSTHIMFKTFEKVEASDGAVNAQGIEVLLEKENDGQWRLIQERILPADEARHDGLTH